MGSSNPSGQPSCTLWKGENLTPKGFSHSEGSWNGNQYWFLHGVAIRDYYIVSIVEAVITLNNLFYHINPRKLRLPKGDVNSSGGYWILCMSLCECMHDPRGK